MTAGERDASQPDGGEPASRADLISGSLSALFGAAVVLHVRSFPELPDGAPGPALFPSIIGGLFVLFGLVLVAQHLMGRRSARPSREGQAPRHDPGEGSATTTATSTTTTSTTTGWVNALWVLGAVVAYLLLSPVLGFPVTMSAVLLALMWRLGAGLRTAVPAALGTTALLYVLFERVLQVPLPAGFGG